MPKRNTLYIACPLPDCYAVFPNETADLYPTMCPHCEGQHTGWEPWEPQNDRTRYENDPLELLEEILTEALETGEAFENGRLYNYFVETIRLLHDAGNTTLAYAEGGTH